MMPAALALALLLCLAAPAAADNWTNKVGFSFGGGAITSAAGTGGEFNIGVTYYLNQWVQFTLSPGYGAYPMYYGYNVGPNSYTDRASVNYVPIDLAVIFTLYRWGPLGIYIGPGAGVNFYWWRQKEGTPVEYTTVRQTLFSAFAEAGLSYHFGGPFTGTIGVTYTIPDVRDFSFKTGELTYGIGGGVAF
jgi:hypothetical protein